jgi:hypothetical protein
MQKIILASTLLISLLSCEVNVKRTTRNPFLEKMGSAFIDNLYNRRYQKCIASMDDTVKAVSKDINLDSVFVTISDKIRNDFGGEVWSTFISSEKTYYEKFPSTLLIFKVESMNIFGYYFFYINDRSNKILLFSEFSRRSQKQI